VTASPWWTAADDAELAVLVREFVDGVFDHRDACSICSQRGPWCRPLVEALEVIIDWRQRRSLHSYAAAMRTLQDLDDLKNLAPERAANRKEAA
jgi:hypothetical protein